MYLSSMWFMPKKDKRLNTITSLGSVLLGIGQRNTNFYVVLHFCNVGFILDNPGLEFRNGLEIYLFSQRQDGLRSLPLPPHYIQWVPEEWSGQGVRLTFHFRLVFFFSWRDDPPVGLGLLIHDDCFF
jgi:hypothetical protein